MPDISSIVVRPESKLDGAAIFEINALAFQRDAEARLVDSLRAARGFRANLSLVAQVDEQDEQLVGHILFTPIVIRGDTTCTAALALAPLAVRPDWQKGGVGSTLVREGLEACRRCGDRIVIVLGHSRYYPRFGFEPASLFGIRAPFAAPDEAFQALPLQPGALAGARGVVEYPPAFAAV